MERMAVKHTASFKIGEPVRAAEGGITPRLRIAHMISHAVLNGVATSLKMLIDAQLRAGHEIMLVHPRNSWIAKQNFAGPVRLFETSFSMKPAELVRTGHAIRDWGRTLVHAHGAGANKFLMVFRIADGVPSVMTAHARRYQLPWMFAHAVVGLSEQTISYYARRRLVARRRIFNVPNMFDVDALTPASPEAREAAREALGLRQDRLVIGAVGAIDHRKRQADIVRLLGHLVSGGVDAELLLIGKYPTEPEVKRDLEEAMADPHLAGRVHLAGHRTDAIRLMPAMDVYVCASAVEEAPIAPLEAMAQALPVVSTNVGNMGDLLPQERLFAVGDIAGMAAAVALLAQDQPLRTREGAAGRKLVRRQLAPSIILPQIDSIYGFAVETARDRNRAYAANR